MIRSAAMERGPAVLLVVSALWLAARCGAGSDAASPGMETALATVSGESIRVEMAALADDSMEGRATGTAGYDRAASRVEERFREIGLAPGAGEGYRQPVPLRAGRLVRSESFVALVGEQGRRNLVDAVDVLLFADLYRLEAEVEARLVFVGQGIDAPEFGIDSYADVEVDGKVVVVLGGAPDSLGHDERAHYASSRVKRETAVRRGARGILFVRRPEDEARLAWDRWVVHSRMERMEWLDAEGRPATASGSLLVQAMLSEAGGRKLFDDGPMSLREIYDAADAGRLPSFELPVRLHARSVTTHRVTSSDNVAGLLRGSDPDLAGETVVLTAHLDHVGIGEGIDGDAIHNGAYDNASGVAILLEVARAMSAATERPRRSVLFLAVTGEEKGLLGSDYFAEHPTVEAAGIVANVNLDMVLMLRPLRDVIAFGAEHSTLGQWVEQAARRIGVDVSPDPMPEQVLFVRSDQLSFVRRGIPSLFLVSGFADDAGRLTGLAENRRWIAEVYHTPADDMNQPIDFEAGADFARINLLLAWQVADATSKPRWHRGDFFGRKFGGLS